MSSEPSQEDIRKTDWSGFRGKTLWDWTGLILTAMIPLVLLFLGQRFSSAQGEISRNIEQDRQNEAAMQNYFNQMSNLMLEHDLLQSVNKSDNKARNIANVRTLTIFQTLDKDRKRKKFVFRFLTETELNKLINGNIDGSEVKSIVYIFGVNLKRVNLKGAKLNELYLKKVNLSKANLGKASLEDSDLRWGKLRKAHLRKAKLKGAILIGADLREANLQRADLREANLNKVRLNNAKLQKANLGEADLSEANLEGANLEGALVTIEQLAEASSLEGATMPDGTLYDGRFDQDGE